jgi:uncharacterized protein
MEGISLFLIGTLAGLAGSIVGLGGGFIIIPFLIFLYHIEPRLLAGTSMAVLFINSISSTIAYARQKKIDFASGFWFGAAMIPGSIMGAFFSKILSSHLFYTIFGLIVMSVSVFLLIKPKISAKNILPATVTRKMTVGEETVVFSYHRGFGLIVSFMTGFLSSLLGIGGGSILVPSMVLLMSFPAHIATATSMFIILISSCIGTISHIALGNVVWHLVFYLALGAFLGGQAGARIAAKLPAKTLLRSLAITLVFVSIRIMTE